MKQLGKFLKTLQKFSRLPPETKIYSGHEYGEKNANFAISIDPDNKKLQDRVALIKKLRLNNFPTVPSTIGAELETNPFLRTGNVELKKFLGLNQDEDAAVLAELRSRRDIF